MNSVFISLKAFKKIKYFIFNETKNVVGPPKIPSGFLGMYPGVWTLSVSGWRIRICDPLFAVNCELAAHCCKLACSFLILTACLFPNAIYVICAYHMHDILRGRLDEKLGWMKVSKEPYFYSPYWKPDHNVTALKSLSWYLFDSGNSFAYFAAVLVEYDVCYCCNAGGHNDSALRHYYYYY